MLITVVDCVCERSKRMNEGLTNSSSSSRSLRVLPS